jgi:hypothetical protein
VKPLDQIAAAPVKPQEYSEQTYVAVPHAFWELTELALAQCPEVALKAFRKSIIIGKDKLLMAGQADAAINGARCAIRTGPIIGRNKRAEEPESEPHRLARSRWYIRRGLPVVFATERGHEFTEAERAVIAEARELDVPITFLEWDGESVDRVGGPA